MMKRVTLIAILAAGCTGEIGGTGGDDDPGGPDPTADNVVAFSFTSPIGVRQLGRNTIVDGCTSVEMGCTEQAVGLMSVTVDRTDVATATAMPGANKFDLTAVAAGTAAVTVNAQNTSQPAMQVGQVQVMAPDNYELTPMLPFVRAGVLPRVHLARTCPAPVRFETNVGAQFNYKLLSATTPLLGSGYYPFTSDQLTEVVPVDLGADLNAISYIAGANATDSTITSTLLPPTVGMPAPTVPDIAITIVEPGQLNGLTLSDQVRAPTTEREVVIYADAQTNGELVCFDASPRTITSTTPAQCTVSDARPVGLLNRGAGPYVITWLGAGPCTVSVEIPGQVGPVTKDYMPIP